MGWGWAVERVSECVDWRVEWTKESPVARWAGLVQWPLTERRMAPVCVVWQLQSTS